MEVRVLSAAFVFLVELGIEPNSLGQRMPPTSEHYLRSMNDYAGLVVPVSGQSYNFNAI